MTAEDLHRRWRSLPVAGLEQIVGHGPCLILAPHPDDESLGCGGLIAACCAARRPPLVAILTDGGGSHPGSRAYPPEQLATVRAREVRRAVAALGLPPERLHFLDQPDGSAAHSGPRFDDTVAHLVQLVQQDGANAILATWRLDPHCDHEAASLIAAAVAERASIRHVAYPVWGWTLSRDVPVDPVSVRGWRLEVARFLPMKRRAIAAHASQHGKVVKDDPSGFQLPQEFLHLFDTGLETFLLP